MPEDDQTTSDDFSVASVAVNVVKDFAITVAGVAVGLTVFNGTLKIANKIQSRRAAKNEQETVAHAI